MPVDLRVARCPGGQPWALVAFAASACHGLTVDGLPSLREHHSSRHAHVLAAIETMADSGIPETRDARAWALENLPPNEPACLLHGDLLGQNLILSLDDEPLGIIDWSEARIGDPAYDLAIVTRGTRQPFKVSDGLQRLLDTYNAQSRYTVTAKQVHLHELYLLAGFYVQDVHTYGLGSPAAEQASARFVGLLRRAEQ